MDSCFQLLSLLAAQSPGAVEEILDRENKRMADSLASKVTRLKSVSGGPLLLPPPGTMEGGSEGGKDLDGFQVVPFSLSHRGTLICVRPRWHLDLLISAGLVGGQVLVTVFVLG